MRCNKEKGEVAKIGKEGRKGEESGEVVSLI